MIIFCRILFFDVDFFKGFFILVVEVFEYFLKNFRRLLNIGNLKSIGKYKLENRKNRKNLKWY